VEFRDDVGHERVDFRLDGIDVARRGASASQLDLRPRLRESLSHLRDAARVRRRRLRLRLTVEEPCRLAGHRSFLALGAADSGVLAAATVRPTMTRPIATPPARASIPDPPSVDVGVSRGKLRGRLPKTRASPAGALRLLQQAVPATHRASRRSRACAWNPGGLLSGARGDYGVSGERDGFCLGHAGPGRRVAVHPVEEA
jgi:hypothetical protein